MCIETVDMREAAKALEVEECSDTEALVEAWQLLLNGANEIDSLRAQLAAAKANAIPWRDGPAVEGGEMPDRPWQTVVAEVTYCDGSTTRRAGYKPDGINIIMHHFEQLYPEQILRYVYIDEIPSVPAKPVEALSTEPINLHWKGDCL